MEILISAVLIAAMLVLAFFAFRTPQAQCGQHEKCDAPSHDKQTEPRPEVMDAARAVMKKHKAALDRLPDFATIQTTNGYTVKIDAEDLPRLSAEKWMFDRKDNQKASAVRRPTGGQSLKTFVLNLERGEYSQYPVVRHINGDSLDCRKKNLKVVKRRKDYDPKQKRNLAKWEIKGALPPGVKWIPLYKYYRVTIDGETIGTYTNRDHAVNVYVAHKANGHARQQAHA